MGIQPVTDMKYFYYHYDSETHMGKCVVDTEVFLVDRIICAVHTVTERKDTSPKFVVKGQCRYAIVTNEDNQVTLYLSDRP